MASHRAPRPKLSLPQELISNSSSPAVSLKSLDIGSRQGSMSQLSNGYNTADIAVAKPHLRLSSSQTSINSSTAATAHVSRSESIASDLNASAAASAKSSRRNRPKPIMNLGGMDLGILQSAVNQQEQQVREEVQAKDSLLDITNELKPTIDIREEDLETIEELGMGSGGTVYKVRHVPTSNIMAKKIIHQIDAKTSKEIMRELQILNKCHSPDIITFFGAYQHQGELCICMEYMDVGSLEMIAKMQGTIVEPIMAKITLAVLKGLTYLYENHRIVHRDIKPSNILVNSKGQIKICDFGVSGVLVNTSANTFVGTGAYMSPERIQGSKYSTQGDTWSLGLTLLELALGRYPFSSPGEDSSQLSVFELLQHIINDPIPTLPRPHEQGGGIYSNQFCDFVRDMMIKDPSKRPTPMMLLQHPFMKLAEQMRVDLVAWSRSFLTPYLNEQQKQRWSVSRQQKRASVADKRRSMGIRVPPVSDGLSSGLANLNLGEQTRRRPC